MFIKENRTFKLNVISFSIVGFLYYVYYSYKMIVYGESLKMNPLYIEGASGIPVSIIGGVTAYYYFKHMSLPLLRIAVNSSLIFIIWIAGVIYIGTNMHGQSNEIFSILWTGVLTVLYFMTLGAINGFVGYWICIINIYIAVHSLFISHDITPIIWVNVLGIVGIDNIYFQWFVVFVSTTLGISEGGVQWITIPNNTTS